MRMNELQLLALAEKALHDNGKRGHLFKRTSENSKWQMRYFVLFQNILFYFEGENTTSKPSGLIFLEGSYVDKMVTPGGGGGGGGLYHYHKNSAASIGTANLQHYFVITYRKEGSKTFELKAESESECNAWVHAIENASFSKMLLQKEELEQKHLHLVQIVESEKTAKFTYTQQVEDLSIEIKKLRAELCTLKREWRLTPNARANREGRGGGLAGLNGGGGGGGGGGAGGTGADGEGGDPNAYGTDDELESEDIQKIKKVQSFFRGWLCRRRWKSIVNEYINSPHAENMRKRNSLVFRMVEAEEEYLEQLQLMVSCFLRPFKMAASSQKPPCSHDEVNSIFLNAETVMFLHQIFLKGLSARMDCWPTLVLGIGDLFDMLLPMLSIYQEYVRNHHFSLQVLAECKQREKFASMLRRLEEKPVTQGRTLETFLTYPMHQVPRYIITLHELLAHTPHNHVERKSLENARMKLEELSRQMHDEVSETENIRNNLAIERIIVGGCDILLDVNQVFIRKGSVLQVLSSSSTGGEGGGGGGGAASRFKSARARLGGSFRGDKGEAVRQCYLFSNHMLLCTRTSGGKLTLIEGFGKIPLQEATLIEDPNEQFQFTVDDGDGSLSSASSHSSETGGGGAGGAGTAGGATISFAAIAATNAAAAAANSTPTKDGGGGGGSSSTPGGKDFGGLDFKIIIDAKMGPPMTIHLVAPTLQEKTAWISDISQCIDNVHFNDLFHGTLNDASSITMPHSIRFFGSRNDPRLFKDDVDIRFSRTLNSCKLPQIRYASPERLFERLTDLRFLSIDFLNTFLLTYRVFTDSITVIEALKRVHYNPEMQLNAMSSSSLHDSSGSLDGETGLPKGQAANQGGAAGGNHGEGGSGGSGSGGAVGHHLHPSASPGHSHHHHHHHHGTLLNINMAGQSTGPVAGVSAANELVSTTIEYDYGRRVSTSSVLSDIAELGGEGGGGGRGGHHHHHRESLIAEVTTNVHAQVTTVQQVSSREQQQAKEMQLFSASSPLIRNSQHWRLSYRKFEEEQARERYLKRMNNRQQHGSISSTSSSVMGGGSVVGGAGGGGGGPPNQLSQAQQQQQQQQQQEGNIFILPAGEPMLAPAITDPIAVPVPPPPSPEVPGYYQKEMAKREKEKQFQAAIGNDSCSGSGSGSDNSHDGSPTSTNSAEETTQLHYQQQQQQFGAIQASSPQRGASNSNAQQTGGGGGGGGKQQSKSNELLLLSATANATAVVGSRGGASSSPASVSSAAAALQVPAHSQSMDTLTDGHGCSSLSSATSSATLVGSDSKSGSPRPSPVRKSPPNGSDFPTAAGSHSPFGQTASQQQQQQQQQMGNSRAAADEADMEDDGMEREEKEDEEEEEYVEGRYKSTNPFATPIRRKSTSQQQQQQPIQSQLSEGTPPPTPPLPGTPPSRKHSTISTGTGHSATSQATPPPISSVGSCFVLPSKAHQQQQQPSAPVKSGGASADARSSSLTGSGGGHHPTAPSGRLSATSTTLTMNYLRVRGAGSKRGSGSSETESAAAGGGAGGGSGSTSVTPRSSFQTDTTGISTPRSSFQHPDSPQMSSKAGVVVTSSRATSRRSSTASAASAFAVATAASSNPPEPTDPLMRMQMMNMAGGGGGGAASRGSSRFSSATGADLKIPGAGGGGGGGGSLAGSISGPSGAQAAANAAAAVAANAARCKRESMISTAATMRVLNVLRHWVSKHSQDFENDERLLKVTTDFLEELVHNTNLLPAEHKAAVQLQQMIAKQTLDAKEKVDLDVLLAPPITPSRDNIETLSALEIAECMTFIDHNIFVRIQSEEFLGQAWMKDEKTVNAFHILLMTKHFNDVSRMVASEILRLPEIPKRVSVIEKWAAVADICRCLHNFNGVLQICAAFTNSSVFRLKRTWEKLNKTQTKQTIDKLQNLVSTDGRFRNMREALHRCDPPCIPYLGMYLTDLSFIEEGTPNFTDDGLLNFSKMRMIAHVIREIRHFQQTPYKIEHNPRVTNYLLDTSRHLGDEVLYQMSLCLEPRLSRLGSRATTVVNATSPSSAGTTFATATTTSQSHQ